MPAAHSSFCCDKINFSFQMGRVTCNENCAVMSPSSAYYYEAKIHVQMVSAFHGNQLRAQLYGLGYPRQPSPRATLAEVTFSLFLSKIQSDVYIRIANLSRGARQLGLASCLTSAGRVTLASGTTFLHINALARLTGTSLGVANVT